MKLNDPLPAICVLYSFWNHHNFPNQVHMCHMNYLLTQQKIQRCCENAGARQPLHSPPSSGASRNTSYRCLVPRRPWSFLRRPCIGLTFLLMASKKRNNKKTPVFLKKMAEFKIPSWWKHLNLLRQRRDVSLLGNGVPIKKLGFV